MGSIADDTRWMDATAQAGLVAAGEVSPRELTEAAIERIEALDGPINSVVVRWFDHAREVADGELPDGPFRGVPFLLKDLYAHYEGQVLTNGNVALKAAQPVSSADTTLVSRFREAGLVTLGRTNSPELGSVPVTEPVAYGPTRNPWNTDRTPGGSSGGAGAAVAAGIVPIAHASDGGGSIRIPASCSGLVGLKPSQGRITLGPQRSESGLERRAVRQPFGPRHRSSARRGPRARRRRHRDRSGAAATLRRRGGRRPRSAADRSARPPSPRRRAARRLCRRRPSAASLLESLGHDVEIGFPSTLADDSFTAALPVDLGDDDGGRARGLRRRDRSPAHRRRRRAGQLGAGRVRQPDDRRSTTRRRSRRSPSTAGRPSSGGPTAGTCCSRRPSPSRRCESVSSTRRPTTRSPACGVRRVGVVHAAVQHHRSTGDQRAAALERRRPADRRAAGGRLRPRGRAHSGGQPTRGCSPWADRARYSPSVVAVRARRWSGRSTPWVRSPSGLPASRTCSSGSSTRRCSPRGGRPRPGRRPSCRRRVSPVTGRDRA